MIINKKIPLWLIGFLECLSELKLNVNRTAYQTDVSAILKYYDDNGNKISQKTAYNYIRKAKEKGWIKERTVIVKSGTLFQRESLESMDNPLYYIRYTDGNSVPPINIPEQLVVLDGEKKLKFYDLTEEARQLLDILKLKQEQIEKVASE